MQKQLYKARLLLEEGRTEAALDELKGVQAPNEQQDVAYLMGWAYIKLGQWEQAKEVLTPLLMAANEKDENRTLADREHLAYYLLKLAAVAITLSHYEDASQHLHACMKVLHDRRVHLPDIRIKVQYYMGTTCVMRGLFDQARQYYEEALRLCGYYERAEELPAVYYGLAETYRRSGQYEKAYEMAQKSAQLYKQQKDERMECEAEHLLGNICFLLKNYKEAVDHYLDSLTLASVNKGPTMIMLNCAALAELRLAEDNIEGAQRFCERAQKELFDCPLPQLVSAVYHIKGKVTYRAYQLAEGDQRQPLLQAALNAYEEALKQLKETQAEADIAKISSEYATILEELGRTQEALEYWRMSLNSLKKA